MSDAPLFQNADEQEAIYAPEGNPDIQARPETEEDSVPAGIAGAGILPGAGAGSGASTSGILPINAVPEVADDDVHEDPTVRGN